MKRNEDQSFLLKKKAIRSKLMPEDILEKIKKGIKKEWKISFFSTIIIGFLTHMYIFTNRIPNHDGLINIYNTQLKFQSGRFFLGPFSGISSYFDLPWINGSLSIIYLGLVAVVLNEFFELRKTLSLILSGGLIVTFPTIASTFSYLFTADGYMMGFLLSVLALLMTKRYKMGFIPGSVLLYLSVGIYQANLTLVLTIIAVWFLRELLFPQKNLKVLFRALSKYGFLVVLGMSYYTITFKLYQKVFSGHLTDYQGIDQIGVHSGSILGKFLQIKDAFMHFFFRGFFTDYPIKLFEVFNLILFVVIVFAVVWLMISNKVYQSPLRMLIMMVCAVLIPIFSYCLYFVSPGVEYHMLMVMSLVSIYQLPLLLYDRFEIRTITIKWLSWGTVLTAALIIFNFSIISNIAYFNATLKYERSAALMNRVLDRMEQTEGFEDATKIAVFGIISMNTQISSTTVSKNIPEMTGAMGEVILSRPYHFEYMLANQFGVALERLSEEELDDLQKDPLVQQMEPWPSKNSVKIYNGIVILKF